METQNLVIDLIKVIKDIERTRQHEESLRLERRAIIKKLYELNYSPTRMAKVTGLHRQRIYQEIYAK